MRFSSENTYTKNGLCDFLYDKANHLGSVMTVVSDKKIPVDADNNGITDHFVADVVSAMDYGSFGNILSGRNFNSSSAKYQFNGKETDPETGTQDYGMRIYNPSLGRFLSVDPLTKSYPTLTPYQFASNSPILGIDLDGKEFYHNNGVFFSTVASGDAKFKVPSEALTLSVNIKAVNQLHSAFVHVKNINDLQTVVTTQNNKDEAPETENTFSINRNVTDKYGNTKSETTGKVSWGSNKYSGRAAAVEQGVGMLTDIIDANRQEGVKLLEIQAIKFKLSGLAVDGAYKTAGFIPPQFKDDARFAADLYNYVFNGIVPAERYLYSPVASKAYGEIIRKLGKTIYDNNPALIKGTYTVPTTPAVIIQPQNNLDQKINVDPIIIPGQNLLQNEIQPYLDEMNKALETNPPVKSTVGPGNG